ncbi:MAG: ECF-type sigma factor [Planctomycetota bacterium]
MESEPESITRDILVDDLSAEQKIERLLPLVYEQLRAAAQHAIATERPDHTLQATAVVHEAYLRLVGDRELPWANRAHFYAAAAEAMRRVLLDHARGKGRVKRGGGRQRQPLTDIMDLAESDSETILALDGAIRRLEDTQSDAAAVLRFRFFAGLTVKQTASALNISPRQVDRLWAFARAWLYREMAKEQSDDTGSGEQFGHSTGDH